MNADGEYHMRLNRSNIEVMLVIAACNAQLGLNTLKRLYIYSSVSSGFSSFRLFVAPVDVDTLSNSNKLLAAVI